MVQIRAVGFWGLVLLGLIAETRANTDSTVSKDDKETVKQDYKAIQSRMLILQKENDELKKRDKKEAIKQILKELEQESKREAYEEVDVKRMKGENRKLKSEIVNLRQIRQKDENAKNRSSNLPIEIDCEEASIVTFLRNVLGSNAIFNNSNSNLEAYKKGFQGEKSFWLGLDKLHELTATGKWDLLVRFKWDIIGKAGGTGGITTTGDCHQIPGSKVDKLAGTWGWATWPNVKVKGASTNYTWHFDAMSQSHNFRDCDVLYKGNNSSAGAGVQNNRPFSISAYCNGGFWFDHLYNFAPTSPFPTFWDICTPALQYYIGSEAAMAIVKVG